MVKSSFAFFVYVLHLFVAVSHSGCLYQSDCRSNYVCCSHQCIYGSSCVGRNCASQSDCTSEEVCCDSDCKYGSDCNGSPCNADSDCGQFNLNCCDGTCQYNDCNDAAVFFGSIFGSLVVLFMFLMCISFAFRRRRALDRGRIIVGQRVTTTTTVRSAMQSSSTYPEQNPPTYQQGYPNYPPPQYEQHQTNRPPPYNLGPSTASEQPPPYTEGPQGGAGRIYTPKPSYGAVASAPPM